MATPPEIDHAVVTALYQFRMATAEQLRVLHTPDSQPELMRRRLRRLRKEGLVEDVVLPQAGKLRAWYLTERGARIAARFRDHHPVPAHLRTTAGAQSILPAWQQHYVVFPRLLFVLADTGERAARQRICDLQAIADGHPLVARMLTGVKAGAARLDDLEQHGTSAAIWHTLTDHTRPLRGAWQL